MFSKFDNLRSKFRSAERHFEPVWAVVSPSREGRGSDEEEQLLLKLYEKVTSKDKMILSNIINKFSVPKDK